jgi:hypothetical protein
MADMGRSLGLMALVIAGLLFIGPARALIIPGGDRRAPVDYAVEVAGFTKVTSLPAITPKALPSSWRANAATLTGSGSAGRGAAEEHLHIGWATPGSLFAGLDESTGDPTALVRQVLGRRGLAVIGHQLIGGRQWDMRRSQRGEPALTTAFGAVTVIVTGNATATQLRLLATSLQ